MPLTYAHYRFGQEALPNMPGDVRRTIQRFRRLFEMGLHGPDIFYYNTAIFRSGNAFLGIKYHEQTGREFFLRVCRAVRLERSEAALSYLYGVLCHYCLDSQCHPFVMKHAPKASHPRIEAEFDRFLLERDGKVPPCTQDLSQHMHLTDGECETVARFYPPATARTVREGVRNMARVTKRFATPEGARRRMVAGSVGLMGKELKAAMIPAQPDPDCRGLDEELLGLYDRAMEGLPGMLSQLQAHLTYNAPFEEEFAATFG